MLETNKMKISIIGGVYKEYCIHPYWDEIYGSAGRASSALASLNIDVDLHTCLNTANYRKFTSDHTAFKKIKVINYGSNINISFFYENDSFAPKFNKPIEKEEIHINHSLDNVIYYSLLEKEFKFESNKLVFDPQSPEEIILKNISNLKSKEKCLILNKHEACKLLNIDENEYYLDKIILCERILLETNFDFLVIKDGPHGGYLYQKNELIHFPAYKTNKIWKIGSGDVFTAYFGYFWMIKNNSPKDSVKLASLATAFYCEKIDFPNEEQIFNSNYIPIKFKKLDNRKVYLAGPFFDLSQKITISKIRDIILSFGMQVFSPMHDVGISKNINVAQKDIDGLNESHIVFAWLDGLDPGTIFEIGYARAKNIPVVILSHRVSEEDLLMFKGTGCFVFENLTSAVYNAAWMA